MVVVVSCGVLYCISVLVISTMPMLKKI